jgi:putative DNA primase/helicase
VALLLTRSAHRALRKFAAGGPGLDPSWSIAMTRSRQWDAWVGEARAVDIGQVVNERGGLNLKASRRGELVGPCPQCGGDDRFAVSTKPGKQVFHCRGCHAKGDVIALVQFLDGIDFEHACEKLSGEPKPVGQQPKRKSQGKLGPIVATYDYVDENGKLLFQTTRHEPKDFRQRRPSNGGWIWGTKGVRLVPYCLPALIQAVEQRRPVYVLEGEKDVLAAQSLGLAATTNPGGAGMGWRLEYNNHFVGADVVVIADDDEHGATHARSVADHLITVVRRVRMLTLPKHDLTDFIKAGGTREAFVGIVERTPDYSAPAGGGAGKSQPVKAGDDDDDIEVERLARLNAFDYERTRKQAAEKLGIRAGMLDKLVATERIALGFGEDKAPGSPVKFSEAELWSDPVNGASLLAEVADAIAAHVVMGAHERDLTALWVVHTYLLDVLLITPRLGVISPSKRCGKTTLLDVLARLVSRPLPAASVTSAVVFRVIEKYRPCLLIDEADAFLSDNEELRGVLNSGHRRGGSVLRSVGDDHEPRSFNTFSPCAIALIGKLPATLADRSIGVNLNRRLQSERIEPFRLDRTEHLDILARKIARWARDNAEVVRAAEPPMPAGVFNREADNLRPLLAIADVAGGLWSERARAAAVQGHHAASEDGERIELLLSDIRDIFDELEEDRISSDELVARLVAIETSPWAEYGRSAKGVSQHKLAALLKPLKVSPHQFKLDGKKNRGYARAQFEDAFARMLPPKEGVNSVPRYLCDEIRTSEVFRSGTPKTKVPSQKYEKPNKDGLSTEVPVQKEGDGHTRVYTLSERAIEQLARNYDTRVFDDDGLVITPQP